MRSRRAPDRGARILRQHGVEGGRGLALVERDRRRQGETGARVLHRARPALLHPAGGRDRPAPAGAGDRLVVERAGVRVVEDRRVAPAPARIRLRRPARDSCRARGRRGTAPPASARPRRVGAAEMGAGEEGAAGGVVVRPDRAPVVGTGAVGPLQDPDPAREQPLEERRRSGSSGWRRTAPPAPRPRRRPRTAAARPAAAARPRTPDPGRAAAHVRPPSLAPRPQSGSQSAFRRFTMAT